MLRPEVIPPGRSWCNECHQSITSSYVKEHRRTQKHRGNARRRDAEPLIPLPVAPGMVRSTGMRPPVSSPEAVSPLEGGTVAVRAEAVRPVAVIRPQPQQQYIPTFAQEMPYENILSRSKSEPVCNSIANIMNNAPAQRCDSTTYHPEECAICMDKIVDCVLVKCGHMCFCLDCANGQKARNNGCPICREPITMIVKVYAP